MTMTCTEIFIKKESIIKVVYFQQKKLLLFTLGRLSYFKLIPFEYLLFKKQKETILLKTTKFLFSLYSTAVFLNSLVTFQYINRKVLVLQGLGLKANLLFKKRIKILELKLGYSHKCFVVLDKEIFLKIRKNILFIHSFNKEKLGNFLFRIKTLRFPDIYKAKGVCYKKEKIKLKLIKKK